MNNINNMYTNLYNTAKQDAKRETSDTLCRVMAKINAEIRTSENADYIDGLKKAKAIVNEYIEE